MSELRAPQANEYKNVIDFLNQHLRKENAWSISAEYPLALSPSNLHNIRILVENGKIVSHAVMKPLLIRTPIAIFKVAAIGSVVTSEEHRNKGYGQRIINECLESARKQDCDFAILWTDIYDYYRKLGFELAGSEMALIINEEFEGETQGLKFMQTNKVDPSAILRLYNLQNVGTIRTLSDIQANLNIPNSKLYTCWDQNNTLLSYAVEGRGVDLSNYVHEWGGNVSKLLPLISEIRRHKGEAITVIAPRHSSNLVRQLQAQGAWLNEGYLGMVKLLNIKNLFFKVRRFARYIGQENFVIEHTGQEYIVGQGSQLFRTESEKDMVQLIFGPQKASELLGFDPKTTEVFENIFPIPMWIGGWDSV